MPDKKKDNTLGALINYPGAERTALPDDFDAMQSALGLKPGLDRPDPLADVPQKDPNTMSPEELMEWDKNRIKNQRQ